MKTLNQFILDYTDNLKHGEIQIAYKGILEFIGILRADLAKKRPDYEMGSVYQGYMDMSYFAISTKLLKEKGLKIAVVYLHEKRTFEVWLSARNREISKFYKSMFFSTSLNNIAFFHDDNNQDAIIECTLTASPNFEDQISLLDIIDHGVMNFITYVANQL